MNGILKGYAYDLEKVIRIDGAKGFIFECGGSEHWDNEKQQYEMIHAYDLGKRRILNITDKEAYLILVSETDGEQRYQFFRLDPSGCKISDFIREKGINCSIIAEYGGRRGKDGILYGFSGETWKNALHGRFGMFTENGYALQYRGWLDYTFYQFELNIRKRGWAVIDGHDIAGFSLWNVTKDIMHDARGLIEKVLEEKVNISGKELADSIKAVGLESESEYLYMFERDDK